MSQVLLPEDGAAVSWNVSELALAVVRVVVVEVLDPEAALKGTEVELELTVPPPELDPFA